MSHETEPPPAVPSFGIVFRGYDRRQVDDYLIRVTQHIVGIEQRFDQALNDGSPRARERAEKVRQELAQTRRRLEGRQPSQSGFAGKVEEILELAEEQAEELLRQAREEAERIVAEAERRTR